MYSQGRVKRALSGYTGLARLPSRIRADPVKYQLAMRKLHVFQWHSLQMFAGSLFLDHGGMAGVFDRFALKQSWGLILDDLFCFRAVS